MEYDVILGCLRRSWLIQTEPVRAHTPALEWVLNWISSSKWLSDRLFTARVEWASLNEANFDLPGTHTELDSLVVREWCEFYHFAVLDRILLDFWHALISSDMQGKLLSLIFLIQYWCFEYIGNPNCLGTLHSRENQQNTRPYNDKIIILLFCVATEKERCGR